MAEESQQTPPNENPEGTGEQQPQAEPPATQPQGPQGAATDDDEVVSLKKSDYQKLVSQRDKNHERASATEQYVMEMAQKEDIKGFLDTPEHKQKFPDVEVDDLMVATDPEQFEAIAGQTQARIDKAAQRRLADIERATAPVLSPEDRAEQVKKLKKNPGMASLESFIDLNSRPTS